MEQKLCESRFPSAEIHSSVALSSPATFFSPLPYLDSTASLPQLHFSAALTSSVTLAGFCAAWRCTTTPFLL